MRTRWTARAVIPCLALSLGACTDSTGPAVDLTDFLLDFCADDVPVFLAVQNDGVSWERITPDAAGTFAFQVAPEVGLAMVWQNSNGFASEFSFVAASEIAPLNGLGCADGAGTKVLSGTMTGIADGQEGVVSMARRTAHVDPSQGGFALNGLPSGPQDLVAHRATFVADGEMPDRVIVRRAQNLVSGATITPALDFSGGDSQDAASNTLTIGGFSPSDDNWLYVDFRTSSGTVHPLQRLVGFTSATPTIGGIPTALTQAGDLHDIEMFAYGPSGTSYRGMRQYHRTPGDRIVTLGPSLSVPVILQQQPSPYVQLRAQLQSQGEYGAFVSAYYLQQIGSAEHSVQVRATAGYIGGTPDTWDVTIPDLSGVAGFPSHAMLQSGFTTTWYVDAFGGGTLATHLGYRTDGSSFRYAGRYAGVSLSERSYRTGPMRWPSPSRRSGGRQ